MNELEKKQGSSDQVVTLEEEIDKLSERVESLQRDNQFKDDVSSQFATEACAVFICKNELTLFFLAPDKAIIMDIILPNCG